ncbi:hypothetical protein [Burkholderia vietnamiensis]|uniref:hypothetical protein n=1 Tax=Burkholderia vietnamiensis TaxID=60552 RepID=UPI000841E51D|nr:hypothetical protein [Burkholderia vietnamiensis]AOJ12408.1 hypothetical protein WJ02_01805 [Burkholderia vietnamiensis]
MSNTQNRSAEHTAYPWQTKTFAAHNHIEEQTARKRYCQTGSYFGVVPRKHANGRLLWPAVIVTKLGAIAANDAAANGKGGVE